MTKFTYLKELVVPKVRIAIQGLPFTIEGYERARNILQTRYGKSSEIVNSYIQSIMSLPNIHGCQPSKIHEFYETLMYNVPSNVQSLETLGKMVKSKWLCQGHNRQARGNKRGPCSYGQWG